MGLFDDLNGGNQPGFYGDSKGNVGNGPMGKTAPPGNSSGAPLSNNANNRNAPLPQGTMGGSAGGFHNADGSPGYKPTQDGGPFPVYNQQARFVPGFGMMGPDLGGAVKGSQAASQIALSNIDSWRENEKLGVAKDYLKIAQEDLGIRKSDLTIRQGDADIRKGEYNMEVDNHGNQMNDYRLKMEDRAKAIATQEGLGEAFKTGGYSGVVDFLGQNGMPQDAINLHAQKLKLDDQIMNLPVMQAKSQAELANARNQVYASGGALAKMIMDTPPAERDAQYQRAKGMFAPILGKVLGDKFDLQTQTNLMMMTAQATPANIMYSAKKTSNSFGSNIGKINGDIMALQNSGATPANSPELQSLLQARDAEKAKYTAAQLDVAKSKTQMAQVSQQTAQTQYNNTKDFMNDLGKASEDFQSASKLDTQIQSAASLFNKNSNNLQAKNIIVNSIMKGVGDNSISMQELSKVGHGSSWLNKIYNIGDKAKPGDFDANDTAQMLDAWRGIMGDKVAQQSKMEANAIDYMTSKPAIFDINKIQDKLPTNQYLQTQMMGNAANASGSLVTQMPWLQSLPSQMQSDAVIAITQMHLPADKVQAQAFQMMKEQGIQPKMPTDPQAQQAIQQQAEQQMQIQKQMQIQQQNQADSQQAPGQTQSPEAPAAVPAPQNGSGGMLNGGQMQQGLLNGGQ